ncbi:MAG: phosphotransferase [Paenibacillaceae bacterium]|nr:phosphotransferase [Paenibacillaceae bacterium]
MDDQDFVCLRAWGLHGCVVDYLGPHTYAIITNDKMFVYKKLQHPDWLSALPAPLRTYAPPILRAVAHTAHLMPHCGISFTLHEHALPSRGQPLRRIIDFLCAMHVHALHVHCPVPEYIPQQLDLPIDAALLRDCRSLPALEHALWSKPRPTLAKNTLTHGDAHPGNVVTDGTGMWLIDWDFCRIASPMRDIASVLVHERDRSLREALFAVAIEKLIQNGYPSYGLAHDAPIALCDQAWQWLQWTSMSASIQPHFVSHLEAILHETVPLLP